MTAAAGAALSQILKRRQLHTNFRADPTPQTGLQSPKLGNVFDVIGKENRSGLSRIAP